MPLCIDITTPHQASDTFFAHDGTVAGNTQIQNRCVVNVSEKPYSRCGRPVYIEIGNKVRVAVECASEADIIGCPYRRPLLPPEVYIVHKYEVLSGEGFPPVYLPAQ